jgi:hypothetical protein
MKTLILTVAVLLLVPTLGAQQTETKETPPRVVPQETTENSNVQDSLPAALRPGHPLDPADVDILTGKRDREIEAARRGIPVAGGYYAYSAGYALNGQRAGMLDLPLLTFRRISNPLFFFNFPPGGFGRRGFRGTR